ncbi:methylated-DNA--[protein]-cysteine S-methyltransferase [Pelomonas sp. APW6]|uniref:Methylated-DNA--[protein]-cysteine S-methyltransferase n=1 Tax=Roseateles subflavus TaxID=3053353 RepID=A0ABT7LEF7_9BURK|nr:methylated-DNA--[protein]-cysteine S-methyltransferase [Pelomonas sp. APW6]MDL5030672.1 methylated-DNA--[protein]-cysteine S-methyltransferase [Pelomonas sp. APW6]
MDQPSLKLPATGAPPPRYARVRAAIETIAASPQAPSLESLAQAAGQSPSHFQRSFVQLAGISPKELSQALSLDRAKQALQAAAPVLGASLDAGLSGPSRLHDLFLSLEGLTPGEFKAAGAGLVVQWTCFESLLGPVFLAATPRGVLRMAFLPGVQSDGDGDAGPALAEARAALPAARWVRDDGALAELAAEVQRRLSGAAPQRPIGLLMSGSPLRLQVWRALLAIPPGRICSYSQLAQAVGAPRAVRAVASCVAANAIAYLIPCHRVIRASAQFGEYRWGPQTKRVLLGLELARHAP